MIVVDAANVVGSVPDGWWRDRVGATERLRDRLVPITEHGLPSWTPRPSAQTDSESTPDAGPVEVVLVVEGAARGVAGVPGVRVVVADGSGDDEIVRLVAEECRDRPCLVVTADRDLRRRVTELGAEVAGPRSVR